LKLSGTADGSDLAIQYKDLFVKPAQSPCKLVFTSVKGPNSYDLPSFQAIFQDWELDGSFHYANGISYSIELHSKDLPLKGLSTTVPRWKNLTIAGTVGLNLTASEQLNKLKTIKVNGQFGLKDLDVSDSNDPHFISDTSGTLTLHESKTHIPSLDMGLNLNGFGGAESVVANLNLATPVLSYSYAINMKNVAAQPVVDAGIIVYGNPAFNSYKNTVYGSANFNFKGVGTGLTTELIEKTLNGSGNFIIQNGKLKGLPAIKTINNVFKDKSDEIDFEAIVGTIAVKNRVAALTCNTEGKVGKISANGAINFDGYYAPQMLIKSDIHKEFIDSDAIKSQLPSMIRDQWNVDWAADSKGNIPIDFKLTGDASKTPGLSCLDLSRLIKNVTSHLGQQLQNSAQPIIQNLGSQLKKLF